MPSIGRHTIEFVSYPTATHPPHPSSHPIKLSPAPDWPQHGTVRHATFAAWNQQLSARYGEMWGLGDGEWGMGAKKRRQPQRRIAQRTPILSTCWYAACVLRVCCVLCVGGFSFALLTYLFICQCCTVLYFDRNVGSKIADVLACLLLLLGLSARPPTSAAGWLKG
ncbi:hypothetical protein BKA80DRAFT_281552 [Phyllosticta citrichinensis]